MKRIFGVLGVLGIGLLMTAPGAMSFHGSPYTALGTATHRDTGLVIDVELTWSGANGFGGTGTFRLRPALPPQVPIPPIIKQQLGTAIQGHEVFTNIVWTSQNGCNSIEVVDYLGEATTNPEETFKIIGWQRNNLCTGQAEMHYWGHWLQEFDLDLIVWTY